MKAESDSQFTERFHMLSCLNFVSHATLGRRQGKYHHLHFMAQDSQVMTVEILPGRELGL